MDQLLPWIAGFVVIICLIGLGVFASVFQIWLQAFTSGTPISPIKIFAMRFRKVNPKIIIENKIAAKKSGIDIPIETLEAHYMAQGRVTRVVQALIAAHKAKIELDIDQACAIDLAGRDVREAVNTSVNPKVIDVPSAESGKRSIDAIAGDGIQLRVRARVTVRTEIDRLIGGATEETIVARVGEGIVTTIGSAENHMKVLENPDNISKGVLSRGLDAGTAFAILSIDIADIDVGENIGARLKTDQAEADKQVAQADAEKRRAMAVAQEQEMQALTQENRAKVVLAEAEIPMAMAEAFRSGNLGIMDYYNMKNVMADTQMREDIAKPDNDKPHTDGE